MISVTEQSNGLVYRAPALNNNNTAVPNFAYRAAMAYVTGSHSFKSGFNRTHGFQETTTYNLNPLAYQFNNGVPNQLTMRANPVTFRNHLDNDLGHLRPGQVDAEAHDGGPGAALRPLQRELSRAGRRPGRTGADRGTSCSRPRTT